MDTLFIPFVCNVFCEVEGEIISELVNMTLKFPAEFQERDSAGVVIIFILIYRIFPTEFFTVSCLVFSTFEILFPPFTLPSQPLRKLTIVSAIAFTSASLAT